MKSKKTAALYARVSTEAQWEEGYSIDAQKDMLIACCRAKGIEDFELYIDGGYSGSSLDRPEIKRLCTDVKNGKIDCVIVYKLDRLSRSQKDTLYLIEDVFNPNGVDFISLNENMDTATPIGRAMLGIMSAFAQLERETIKERTRMGMLERVKQGYWMGGGRTPFGYDYDKEKGILVPNSDSAVVKRVYELYLAGYSLMSIAKKLGLGYERLARQILLRKTNAGYIIYNGKEYKGLHKPIIDEETYKRAIALFDKRSRGRLKGADNLLTGLIYCGVCGAKMRYQKWGKSGYKIYCYSQDKGKPHLSRSDECDNHKIWAHELEDIVTEDLFRMAHKRVSGEIEEVEASDIEILKGRREGAVKRLKRLYKLYAQSDDSVLIETINEVKEEISELDGRIEAEEKLLSKNTADIENFSELATMEDVWQYMTKKEKQHVFRRYIDKIVVSYDKVDIYYTLPEKM